MKTGWEKFRVMKQFYEEGMELYSRPKDMPDFKRVGTKEAVSPSWEWNDIDYKCLPHKPEGIIVKASFLREVIDKMYEANGIIEAARECMPSSEDLDSITRSLSKFEDKASEAEDLCTELRDSSSTILRELEDISYFDSDSWDENACNNLAKEISELIDGASED